MDKTPEQIAADHYESIVAWRKAFVAWRKAFDEMHQRAMRAEATVERYRDVFESTAWTIQNQPAAKALCQAVTACSLGPSDDDGMLGLYDLIPDEWCAPDRPTVTDDIAENIAFAALDAWLTASRAILQQENTNAD